MNYIFSKKQNKNRSGGYALYFAIILTGLLLLVSYATANISIKELLLSGFASDSHLAFYNTDSGLECAMYWDLKNPGGVSAFDVTTPANSITCNGGSVGITTGTNNGNPTRSFQINVTNGCTLVTVTKVVSGANSGTTLIESRGYNVCSGSRRLERGVKIQY